jgi:hypothetical protein
MKSESVKRPLRQVFTNLWHSVFGTRLSLLCTSACDEGIKRGGAEAAVFSQIIAADDFLTFKRMMHARSASLDFQAHLQYEKIRNSAMPVDSAAAMESCGQHVISHSDAGHQQAIQQHKFQQIESFVSRSTCESPLRNSNSAYETDSKESQGRDVDDDDERLLKEALGETISALLGVPFSRCFAFIPCLQNFQSLLSRKCGHGLSKRKMTLRLPSV